MDTPMRQMDGIRLFALMYTSGDDIGRVGKIGDILHCVWGMHPDGDGEPMGVLSARTAMGQLCDDPIPLDWYSKDDRPSLRADVQACDYSVVGRRLLCLFCSLQNLQVDWIGNSGVTLSVFPNFLIRHILRQHVNPMPTIKINDNHKTIVTNIHYIQPTL
jgi:hypothetical protein